MTVIEKSAEGSPENAVVLPTGWVARAVQQLECMKRYLETATQKWHRYMGDECPNAYQQSLEEVSNLLASAKTEEPLDPNHEQNVLIDAHAQEIYDLQHLLLQALPVVETMARHWDGFPTPSISGTSEWNLAHKIREACKMSPCDSVAVKAV